MSNRKIEFEMAYFNKVLENMDKKELVKDIKKKEAGYEEFEFLPSEMEHLCRTKDKYFQDGLDWIELLERVDVHKALKSLSKEEQTLLSYLYFKDKTQDELAKIYKKHPSVLSRKHIKIIIKIRKFLFEK